MLHISHTHTVWPNLKLPICHPESAINHAESLSQSHEQQVLQAVPGHPQPLHETVLAVAHGQTKAHVCHIVPGEQQPGQAHQGGPAHHQDAHGGRVHQLGEKEAGAHGRPRGVARGEGVALHEEVGEDVRAVLGGHAASDQGLHQSDQQQVQQQSCEEETESAAEVSVWITLLYNIIIYCNSEASLSPRSTLFLLLAKWAVMSLWFTDPWLSIQLYNQAAFGNYWLYWRLIHHLCFIDSSNWKRFIVYVPLAAFPLNLVIMLVKKNWILSQTGNSQTALIHGLKLTQKVFVNYHRLQCICKGCL